MTTYSMQFRGASNNRLFNVIIPFFTKLEPQRVSISRIRSVGIVTPYLFNTLFDF